MVTLSKKTYDIIHFTVKVLDSDITKGKCLLANKCMVKVAVARTLDQEYPMVGSHKVRVDAGHIKFNARGYRWIADTPPEARIALINYDNKHKRHLVKPFSFKVMARRVSKIRPGGAFTKERRRQIDIARRARETRTGIKEHKRYTLRHRVVGYA